MNNSFPNTHNHHCTCVVIASTGVIIEGPSGSGKTSLSLGLREAAILRGIDFSFVSDDQVILNVENQQVWASTPPAIAGKVEIFGHGLARIDFTPKCKVALICRQTPQEKITRMPIPATSMLMGVELPTIETPIRHEAQGVRIVFQALSIAI